MPTLLPLPEQQFFDSSGKPLAGGLVYYYIPGTTTFKDTWADILTVVKNPNPVLLDSGGFGIVYGTGQYRVVVTDSLGNQIYDQLTASNDYGLSLTDFGVSAAMIPVLTAATVDEAEALLIANQPGGGGGSTTSLNTSSTFNINPGLETLHVFPTANPPDTLASLNVQGTTVNGPAREFLVNLGLTTNIGSGTPGTLVTNDKVTLYVGLQANPGTSDVWTVNSCLTMALGSGSYNAQGYELDFNNMCANRGANGNLLSDFTAPIAQGLTVTGASNFSSTTGIAIEGTSNVANNVMWNRGLTLIGKMGICGIQDWTTTPVAMQFDGSYSVAGLNFTAIHGNAGSFTSTAVFMKNNQFLAWQDAATTHVITDFVDVANNRYVGKGSSAGVTSGVIIGAATIPEVTNVFNLGTASNRWLDCWINNLRIPNTCAITWENNPANNGNVSALIVDYVDSNNNRIIGSGSSIIFMGSEVSPINPGINLGNTNNYWGTVFSSNGIAAPSDIRLKTSIEPLPPMLDIINSIEPISFKWKDKNIDEKIHYGFSASDIKNNFDKNFAGYHELDDKKFLHKDELIAVLWKSQKELISKIEMLTDRIKFLEK